MHDLDIKRKSDVDHAVFPEKGGWEFPLEGDVFVLFPQSRMLGLDIADRTSTFTRLHPDVSGQYTENRDFTRWRSSESNSGVQLEINHLPQRSRLRPPSVPPLA